MPLTPKFYQDIQLVINFLNNHRVNLYSITEILETSNPNDNFFKIYINFPNSGVVAHRPCCPDRPNLIAGYADATASGFWVGMFSKQEIIDIFHSIQNFANQVGALWQLKNNLLCQRCKV